ncbi:MAG: exodeoxyribonuclease VII small subunit [Lachnospiraceae bacterium]|nr:exodeoxyribonuclease VII small subunit [Lachnospiraceae bacterium]MEE0919667.1 exodeoxyribonuclease VII small subunit [Lachnospiraceae bacterium]
MAKEITLEQTFEKLEAVISRLEKEDISLEESFKIYKEGIKLIQNCNDKIDKVEKAVLKLNENGELDEF